MKPAHYKVVCLSVYTRDLDEWDAKIAQAKRLGYTSATRSSLVRLAMAKLDLSTLTAVERTIGPVEPAEVLAAVQQPPAKVTRIVCAMCRTEFTSRSTTKLPARCRSCAIQVNRRSAVAR